jgi:GntR family transcriptional regulator, rspAB operon transcriptional repressor
MQTTAAEQVYAHLLSRILHNELKPGDWVELKQLAEGMKTSLMPIAEAVQRLTLDDFLVSVLRKGTQVRVPGAEDVRGQILVREALECQAARLYCGAPVQAARSRLQRLAKTADAPSGKVPLGRPNSHFTRRWLNWSIVRRFCKTTCAS